MSNIFLLLCFLYLKIVKLRNQTLSLSLSLSLECTSTEKPSTTLSHTYILAKAYTYVCTLDNAYTHNLPTYLPTTYLSICPIGAYKIYPWLPVSISLWPPFASVKLNSGQNVRRFNFKYLQKGFFTETKSVLIYLWGEATHVLHQWPKA